MTIAMSNDELEKRFQSIESAISQLRTMLGNAVSVKEQRQLTYVRNQTITDLVTRVSALESQLELLQGQVAAVSGI